MSDSKAWEAMGDVSETTPPDDIPRPIAKLALEGLRRAEARKNKDELPVPVPWPEYATIMGGGLWPGMHVLVAGTGAGKTTFATQIAITAAEAGCPTAYVGLELDEAQVGLRMVAEQAKVGWSKLYLGKHSEDQLSRAQAAAELMTNWPLYAVMGNPSGWPASKLETIAAWLAEDSKHRAGANKPRPGLIVLDFLQLIGAEGKEDRTELRERIGRAAYTARQASRAHNVAVVLVSSIARNNYQSIASGAAEAGLRPEKNGEPAFMFNPDAIVGLGKESGEIEYAADSVTVLIRSPNEKKQPVVLCAVPKLRYGRPSWFPTNFDGLRFNAIAFSEIPEAKAKPKSKGEKAKHEKSDSTDVDGEGYFPK